MIFMEMFQLVMPMPNVTHLVLRATFTKATTRHVGTFDFRPGIQMGG